MSESPVLGPWGKMHLSFILHEWHRVVQENEETAKAAMFSLDRLLFCRICKEILYQRREVKEDSGKAFGDYDICNKPLRINKMYQGESHPELKNGQGARQKETAPGRNSLVVQMVFGLLDLPKTFARLNYRYRHISQNNQP